MTATDVLRRLLDERGVEYVLDEEYGKKYPPEKRVTWSCDLAGEDMTVTARDYCISINDDGSADYCLDLEFHEVFTPEQAIAATLGATDAKPTQAESSGMCHITDEQSFWHRMADEEPSDEKGKYLLLGKRGAMYLANGFHVWEHSGRRSFYIPNNRSGYVDFDKVKAWAVVPEMGVEQ